VRDRMGGKFRQIEQFVDLLDSALRESNLLQRRSVPNSPLISMCDMGAGKGYLTFAAYDYLVNTVNARAEVTGIEHRKPLVTLCNEVAQKCSFPRLRFIASNILDYPSSALDILVALHACDTATDDALYYGIRAGAQIIMTSPCCHKQIRAQVDQSASRYSLRDILRHGTFAGRVSEIVTDALRVLILERAGYYTRVSEFVSPDYTTKNVMLIAVKRQIKLSRKACVELDDRIRMLMQLFGVEQHRLQQLILGDERDLTGGRG